MSALKKFLVRGIGTDLQAENEQEVLDLFLQGRCKSGDFLYNFETNSWSHLADLALMQSHFKDKPANLPSEKKVIYYQQQDRTRSVQGPFSLKEILEKQKNHEIGLSTWVYVDGDKEWRQISSVKILRDAIPGVPADTPIPAVEEVPQHSPIELTVPEKIAPEQVKLDIAEPSLLIDVSPSLLFDVKAAAAKEAANEAPIEREDQTMAISVLGLSAEPHPAPAPEPRRSPPPLPAVKIPSALPPSPANPANPNQLRAPTETEKFDGLTAEIPTDAMWLIKKANSEEVTGPFRFMEVAKAIEEKQLDKNNDKISKVGSKSFVKLAQQYEFNVQYSVETVVEAGLEKQKIFIRRRHPRVPYLANVQVTQKGNLVAATCVNISAGGILMEAIKADFHLGEVIEVKILPALINHAITCNALIIGKIPKIPPGFALKFQDLKQADKEVIEFFVQEAMRREQAKP